jgi:hypothetical protein
MNTVTPRHALRPKLVLGLLVPLIAFIVLERALGNATAALAITDAIPLLWVVAIAISRRRLDRLALIPLFVFATALALSIALGGNSLPLELRRSVFPAVLGLACLVSAALDRPLLAVVARRVGGARAGRGDLESRLYTPDARRVMTVLTAIIGVSAVADAVAQVVLALTVSTSTFAIVARIVSYAIFGAGLAACAVYLRPNRAALRPAPQRDAGGP